MIIKSENPRSGERSTRNPMIGEREEQNLIGFLT